MSVLVPPVAVVMGPPGCGKSADALAAAPNALVVTCPGGSVPSVSLWGFEPKHVITLNNETDGLDEMAKLVKEKLRTLGSNVDAVIIDDLSLIGFRTIRLIRKGTPKMNNLVLYGQFRERAAQVFDDLRDTGRVVLASMHVTRPEYVLDKDGEPTTEVKSAGGPSIPGAKAGPELVKAVDMVYLADRAVPAGLAAVSVGSADWPWIYKAGPFFYGSDKWETKDRWNVAVYPTGMLPSNMGEILRFIGRRNGIKVPARLVPEQEQWVKSSADAIIGGASQSSVLRELDDRLERAGKPLHLRKWTMRDVVARVQIEQLHKPAAAMAAFY